MHKLDLRRIAAFVAVAMVCLANCCTVAQASEKWIGSWATAPSAQSAPPAVITADGITIRNIVHMSVGGSSIRLKFSNELGTDPLIFGKATIALEGDQGVLEGPVYPVTFGGNPSTTIPPGAVVLSDPIQMQVSPFGSLSVSIFLPQQPIHVWTRHALAVQTNFIAVGDQTAKPVLAESKSITSSYFIKAVDVSCSGDCGAIVTLGDSITDGAASSINKNRRWPDVLAARLAANPGTARLSVLNEGISGNRLLHEGAGPSAIARFDRDVMAQSGVKYLIVLEGINDIGATTRAKNPSDPVTVEDLEWSLSQIASRAHDAGIKVIGATLTPAGHGSASGEAMRSKLNEWIRTTNIFDGVVDFDKAVRNPQQPTTMLPDADSGDSLHPGDNGYRRMGDAVDLKLF